MLSPSSPTERNGVGEGDGETEEETLDTTTIEEVKDGIVETGKLTN